MKAKRLMILYTLNGEFKTKGYSPVALAGNSEARVICIDTYKGCGLAYNELIVQLTKKHK